MAYAGSETTQELIDRISERLTLEGLSTAGRGPAAVVAAINEVAREVGDLFAEYPHPPQIVRIERTVVSGDTEILLPDGSDEDEPRLLSLRETTIQIGGGSIFPLTIYSHRAAETNPELRNTGSWALVDENSQLTFLSPDGAPSAAIVRLAYVPALPLLTTQEMTVKPFENVPPEWVDALVDVATGRLAPADSKAAARYGPRGQAKLETQAALLRTRARRSAGD